MMEKKRIACFFTGGYTEYLAMKSFLEKINTQLNYIRLCPVSARKSRAAIRGREIGNLRGDTNGLTGKALTDFVLSEVDKDYFKREAYDGIVIEDDKDSRFLIKIQGGCALANQTEWKEHQKLMQNKLKAKGITVPIIYFLAAPEVEAWFVADFDNSFGTVYQNQLKAQNGYFMTQFRKYLVQEILTDSYSEQIESYGYFDGKYRKLSEELQSALKLKTFLPKFKGAPPVADIEYKKTDNGSEMLRSIDPEKVAKKCQVFFKDSYYALQSL